MPCGLRAGLTLLGTDYPTPTGPACATTACHRPCRAHLRAVAWLGKSTEARHEAFIWLGIRIQREAAPRRDRPRCGKACRTASGRAAPAIAQLVGDIAKSRRGWWQPTRDLAVQIEDTIAWRRKIHARELSRQSRRRLPVAAKTALATAGAIGGVPARRTPECELSDATMCTSITGMSARRSIS